MKIKEFKHEPVQPDTYEASMAMNQLHKIGRHAIKLHNLIDDNAEMESWVAKKIDLAGDYVKKVHGYMQGVEAGYYEAHGGEHTTSGRSMTKGEMAKREKIVKAMKKDKAGFKKRYGKDADAVMYATATKQAMGELKKMPKGTGTMYGVKEDAPFGSGMDLVRMAVLRKFISAEEYMNYAKELKAAGEEVEEKYADWPEGEGFGSSDGNFAIKDMMSAAGYEFDEQDKGGRFIVTKMPEKLEKMGIKNARMRDAVTTDSLEARLETKLRESREQIGDYAREIKSGRIVRIVDYTDDDEGIYTISYGEDKGENDVTAKDLKFLDQTGMDQEEISKFDEDAGEGHMSKSTLYHTAKYAIALMQMIKKGDDLEGWVQSKLNKAADYLQGVYNYEEYQKLNPYREELDSKILDRHAGIVQKHIDEILAKETELDDIDTKPGMMRILAKRVNEVEKEIAKENRKNTDEAHGGQHTTSGRSMTKGEMNKREKIVKGMKKDKAGFKKRYGKDAEAVMYATATKQAMKDDEANESGIMYRAGVKKYGKKGMTAIQSAAGKGASHQEIGKIKDKYLKDEDLDEGKIKDWAKSLAMAGVFVAGMAGMGSIQDAIDNSVPAVKAMNTAYEMAVDQGNNELAEMIKNDLSAVKVRLESGKDLGFVKGMQDKYSKFIQTEGLAYESRLSVLLNQRLK